MITHSLQWLDIVVNSVKCLRCCIYFRSTGPVRVCSVHRSRSDETQAENSYVCFTYLLTLSSLLWLVGFHTGTLMCAKHLLSLLDVNLYIIRGLVKIVHGCIVIIVYLYHSFFDKFCILPVDIYYILMNT